MPVVCMLYRVAIDVLSCYIHEFNYWIVIWFYSFLSHFVSFVSMNVVDLIVGYRDVTEPANIRIRRMQISFAKSVGFGCGFVAQSKLPAISLL